MLHEMKRASTYGEKVEFVWVDVEYKDYLMRVYSVEPKPAIIVLRPKFDLYWKDRGSKDLNVWIDDIVKGKINGKSSLGMIMRGWKAIVWSGEVVYDWFVDNPFYFWSVFILVVGGFFWQLFGGARGDVGEKAD